MANSSPNSRARSTSSPEPFFENSDFESPNGKEYAKALKSPQKVKGKNLNKPQKQLKPVYTVISGFSPMNSEVVESSQDPLHISGNFEIKKLENTKFVLGNRKLPKKFETKPQTDLRGKLPTKRVSF